MFRTIIAATDGSAQGKKAARLAGNLARKYKSSVVLLHVRPEYGSVDMTPPLGKRRLPEKVRQELDRLAEMERTLVTDETIPMSMPVSQKALDAIASLILDDAEKAAKGGGAKRINRALLKGDPAEGILKTVKRKKADAVVMGRRGIGRLAGLLIGSVSQKVSNLANCTVITVK